MALRVASPALLPRPSPSDLPPVPRSGTEHPHAPTQPRPASPSSLSKPLPSTPKPHIAAKAPSRPVSFIVPPPPVHRVRTASAASRRALGRLFQAPRVLACLLYQLSWQDFHALFSTCREFRSRMLQDPDCRHVVLSHYVPGYRFALQICDDQHGRELDVDPHDFTLFGPSLLRFRHGHC